MIAFALAVALAASPPGDDGAGAAVRGASEAPAAAAFERMRALAGVWRRAGDAGPALRIRFATSAGDTVLVETWERGGRPHSITLYHLDGARLIATHYCPQGNQPRLASTGQGDRIDFAFRDATDLDVGEPHLRALSFDLHDPARIVRRETYRQGDVDEASELILVRDAGNAD